MKLIISDEVFISNLSIKIPKKIIIIKEVSSNISQPIKIPDIILGQYNFKSTLFINFNIKKFRFIQLFILCFYRLPKIKHQANGFKAYCLAN